MAPPLFFLPRCDEPLSRGLLQARGLHKLLADARLDYDMTLLNVSKIGPGGLPGKILSVQTADGRVPDLLGYYPEQQEWQPVGHGDQVWIGFDRERPPTPADLVRREVIRGHAIAISDKHSVEVPVIRREDGSTHLPQKYMKGPEGWRQEVRAEWKPLWEATGPIVDYLFDQVGELSVAAACEFAVRVLSVNYRFDAELQNRLEWLGSDVLVKILAAACDIPLVAAFDNVPSDLVDESAKKKAS